VTRLTFVLFDVAVRLQVRTQVAPIGERAAAVTATEWLLACTVTSYVRARARTYPYAYAGVLAAATAD
jgi:hypothetical protein